MYKIDVIIPAYNVEKYLPALFKSLDDQILDINKYNIIFVNDGSTDNTKTLLEEFVLKKKNAKLISIKNSGVGKARQVGFDAGTSDYVLYIDPDDFLSKKYLLTWYRKNKGYEDLIYSNWFLSSTKTGTGTKFPISDKLKYFFIILWGAFKRRPRIVGTQNKLWKRSTVSRVKWRNYKKAQDVVYFCENIVNVETIRKIGHGTSYYYRDMRKGSVNQRAKGDELLRDIELKSIKKSVEALLSYETKNKYVVKIIKNELNYRTEQIKKWK